MCFHFFNDSQKHLNKQSKSCYSFSCFNKKTYNEANETTQPNNENNDLDFYGQFFWEGMPIYMGKLPRSAKVKGYNITSDIVLNFAQKNLNLANKHNTLMKIFQLDHEYENSNKKKCFKDIFQESDSDIFYPSEFFEETNIAQIFKKNNFDSLNGKLKTIPENESLHCFHTEF
ncbi:uncharacterized protein T551_02075 [Pneumocystis jirovecii RU7]|uniref:Uncharacterized protein n=1 Tax=Pneumocystis jirovecii (strain RU7) TaxID=1408657 RepID=A0A0W4ZM72_PNEJ7|nr:uncharacterized protein T551_02075 [Pneumocystis jirovecii RU7]KTW29459.1 hypothetical protein T551_02075 [Pneumocystis jirovecii RU7]